MRKSLLLLLVTLVAVCVSPTERITAASGTISTVAFTQTATDTISALLAGANGEMMRFSADYQSFSVDRGASWHAVATLRSMFAQAGERITLTVPEAKASTTTFRVDRVILDDEGSQVVIQLLGNDGSPAACVYNALTTPTGRTLLDGLNKANLSTPYAGNATSGSLKQRIFYRLVVLNEAAVVCGRALTGALTGTPQ